MSRSYKKHAAGGVTNAPSEKDDKRRTNRAVRRISKVRIFKGREPIDNPNEYQTIWSFAKDGKRFYSVNQLARRPKLLRK